MTPSYYLDLTERQSSNTWLQKTFFQLAIKRCWFGYDIPPTLKLSIPDPKPLLLLSAVVEFLKLDPPELMLLTEFADVLKGPLSRKSERALAFPSLWFPFVLAGVLLLLLLFGVNRPLCCWALEAGALEKMSLKYPLS